MENNSVLLQSTGDNEEPANAPAFYEEFEEMLPILITGEE